MLSNLEKGGLMKPNYELKAKAIEEGFTVQERNISRAEWKYWQSYYNWEENGEEIPGEIIGAYKEATKKREILANNELFKEAYKINQASYKRRNRLEKKISQWLSETTCIFLTLTFKDEIFSRTSEATRRQYVRRALQKASDRFIANIDYGAKNQREHYHAIVVCEDVNRDIWSKYGNINFERIKATSDSNKLAKYICKLTNHAIKETTRQNRVIYSKK